MSRRKQKEKSKLLIIVVLAIIVIIAVLLGVKLSKKGDCVNTNETIENGTGETVAKKINIVDVNSKSRPFAVMINNNHSAWPVCGVQDAYLVYEIVAEGGITRMMALYKDKDTAKVGSVRSSRHYYIDYAEENDAIYIHWGGSPQAYTRLNQGIDHIDGIALEGSVFFRDTSLKRDYEHTGFTSMKNVREYAEKQGYTRDTNKDLLLNYSVDEINLDNIQNAQSANKVDIKYSGYHTTSYEYDEENQVYKRSMSGTADVDLVTGQQCTVKNIIVYSISNYTLDDGSDKGRQELDNIGSGSGYYITNGYAAPITWSKSSHSGQTVYKYADGNEINVNDGNTFIQIYPKTGSLTITPKTDAQTVTE